MRYRSMSYAVAAAIAAFGMSLPALAQDGEPTGLPGGLSGTFVFGPGTAPDYEGSDDYRFVPYAAARFDYNGYGLAVTGPGLRADIVPSQAVSAGPILRYKFARDDVDSDAVDNLDDVDDAIELGGYVGYSVPAGLSQRDSLGATITIVTDVADGHNGTKASLDGSYRLPLSRTLRASLGASVSAVSGNYADAYFTVDANNVGTSSLSFYDADGGFHDAGLSLGLNYAITRHVGVSSRIAYTRLFGDAADSPVVKDEGSANQIFAGIGISYRF